ncbi:phage tail tape measure protein [Serratia rubidaea]|uniref:phage tail tape measure protein n=1 Tax=Serratia rubidaea TaxID=61652 RepID=UPI0022B8CBDA|nr:phage tail tape measure protein [Serratia rubidaea]WBF44720.1 phage tail tape measure protein [Serratia rubidaea]
MSNSEPLQSFIKKLQQTMEPLNRLLNTSKALSNENQKLEKKLQGLNSELGSTTSALGKTKVEITQLSKQLNKGGKASENYIQTLKKSQQNAEKISNRQNQLQKKIAQQQDSIKTRQAQTDPAPGKDKKSMVAHGKATYDKARGAITTIGNFIQPGVRFEKTMSELQAILSINGDDKSIETLRQQSHDLSSLYGLSPADIADAQLSVVQQGYRGKDITAATLATLPLSQLDDLDVNASTSIFKSVQKSFDIPLEESQRIADVLTTGFTLGNTKLSDFANSLKELAPIAHDSGVSLEETAAVLSIMSENAVDKEQAESASKALLIQLNSSSGTAKKELLKQGIKTQDNNGKSLPINKIIENINASTKEKGLDTQQQRKYLEKIFQGEALGAAKQLLESVREGKLNERINAEKNSNGTSLHLLKMKSDNLDGDLNRMKSVWDKIRTDLFGGKSDFLRGVIQQATNLLEKIDKWIAKNPKLSSDIVTLVGGITMLKGGMGLFGMESLKIPQVLGNIMRVLGLLMRIPYIGWIATIAAAVTLIWVNWDKIEPKLQAIMERIKDGIINTANEIKTALRNMFSFPDLGEMFKNVKINDVLNNFRKYLSGNPDSPSQPSEPGQPNKLKLPNILDLFNVNPRRPKIIPVPGLNFLSMGNSNNAFTQEQDSPLTHTKPIMAIAATSSPSQVIQSPSITVNVTPQAGQNEHALGREVAWQIKKILLNQSTNARSMMS